MSNLYVRLANGEDETTEALADLLERVLAGDRERNTSRFGDFVSDVLLGRATSQGGKERFLGLVDGSGGSLSMRTQHRIPEGTIPDLVIFRSGEPICVVEVKIGAAIGEKQLEGYGKWLKGEACCRYEPALVLLTQATGVPEEFTDPSDVRYGVSLRSAAFWSDVAAWFAALSRGEEFVEEPLKTLASEFAEFLREDAMPTLDDAAIARNYLAHSYGKLTEAVRNMQDGYAFPSHWSAGRGLGVGAVGIWKSRYPEKDLKTRYVYCGLCFKPVDWNDETLYGYRRYENESAESPKPVELGDGFYAFVCIHAKGEDCKWVPGFTENRWYEWNDGVLKVSRDGLAVDSNEWWYFLAEDRSEAGYARICALQELLDDDGRMGNRLRDWTHEALAKTQGLWTELFGDSG